MKSKRSLKLPSGYLVQHRPNGFMLWRAVGNHERPSHAIRGGIGFETMKEAVDAAWADASEKAEVDDGIDV